MPFSIKNALTNIVWFENHIFLNLFEFQTFWAKWPKNWKALEMNSEDVETLQGIIISPTEHVLKSWEGYDKNWMHFVYKLDHLLRSMRVSNENSTITKAFHFLYLCQPQTFCVINMHHSKPHPKISTLSNFIFYFSSI